MATSNKRKSRGKLAVVNRPWSALTKHQRDLRLDTLAAWHERDIFTDDLCDSYDKRISERAKRSTELEMRAMVRAFKMGIDLSTPGIVGRLMKETDWTKFLKATDADTSTPKGTPSWFPEGTRQAGDRWHVQIALQNHREGEGQSTLDTSERRFA